MNLQNLRTLLTSMSSTRPFFISENDYKACLVKVLIDNGYCVYSECSFQTISIGMIKVDILVFDPFTQSSHPIEIKFKTKKECCSLLPCNYPQQFFLKNHGAQPINEYLFWKDVHRIEEVKNSHKSLGTGFVIFLTNDSYYWSASNSSATINAGFRINSGALTNQIVWSGPQSPNYTCGTVQYPSFNLRQSYQNYQWTNYSSAYDINKTPTKEFKVLIIGI